MVVAAPVEIVRTLDSHNDRLWKEEHRGERLSFTFSRVRWKRGTEIQLTVLIGLVSVPKEIELGLERPKFYVLLLSSIYLTGIVGTGRWGYLIDARTKKVVGSRLKSCMSSKEM